uniref:Promoter proximal ORF n=1 Tax=Pseudomonas syringae TaxID=317 RepID=Q52503_PSESX|nr:promoter proximal ORF [Pseudomonas savastanoi]
MPGRTPANWLDKAMVAVARIRQRKPQAAVPAALLQAPHAMEFVWSTTKTFTECHCPAYTPYTQASAWSASAVVSAY